jgi:hypothetical protein
MPTKTAQEKKAAPSKKSAGKSVSAAARSGPLPPYGVAIREALARGDAREMQGLATATRQHLKNVQTARSDCPRQVGGIHRQETLIVETRSLKRRR